MPYFTHCIVPRKIQEMLWYPVDEVWYTWCKYAKGYVVGGKLLCWFLLLQLTLLEWELSGGQLEAVAAALAQVGPEELGQERNFTCKRYTADSDMHSTGWQLLAGSWDQEILGTFTHILVVWWVDYSQDWSHLLLQLTILEWVAEQPCHGVRVYRNKTSFPT